MITVTIKESKILYYYYIWCNKSFGEVIIALHNKRLEVKITGETYE